MRRAHLYALLLSACGDDDLSADAAPMDATTRDATTEPDAAPSTDARPMDSDDAGPADARAPDASTETGACDVLVPSGPVVRVEPSQAAELPSIVRGVATGTTIVLADGTYRLSGADEGSRRLRFHVPSVTLIGESGDASRAIIDAAYETNEALYITASDVTIAHVTIMRAVDHLVHVTAEDAAATNVTGTVLYGLRLLDAGEQLVKVNSNGGDTAFVDGGRIECSAFELTDEGRPRVERNPGGCYTGGIDVHEGRDWVVRRNDFRGIYCAGEGLAEHAIHFWRGARDTLIENNVIVDCARGIGLGLGADGGRTYSDDPFPGVSPIGHFGGIVRNNVVFATIAYYDTGIELQQAHGVRVHHNTLLSDARASGFYSSIDYRFANTDVELRNNLVRRITMRDGATGALEANLEDAALDLVVDADGGDFHLRASATAAIDQGVIVAEAGVDLDGEPHGDTPDIGADER